MAVWIVKAGGDGDEEPTAIDSAVATIHWNELPDLSGFDSREELKAMYREAIPGCTNAQVSNGVAQVWAFRSKIAKGDLVIIPLVSMWKFMLAVGEVTGPYAYRQDLGREVRHTRPVEWFCADLPRSRLDADLSAALDHSGTVCPIRNPPDAEERFRAAVRDEIDRRHRRLCGKIPAVEANVVHKDGTYPVRLHSLPRKGELLRVCPRGTNVPRHFKVEMIVHRLAQADSTHAVDVHVGDAGEGEVPVRAGAEVVPPPAPPQTEAEWWDEEAERLNAMGEIAARLGVGPKVPPRHLRPPLPALNPDGSLRADTDAEADEEIGQSTDPIDCTSQPEAGR